MSSTETLGIGLGGEFMNRIAIRSAGAVARCTVVVVILLPLPLPLPEVVVVVVVVIIAVVNGRR